MLVSLPIAILFVIIVVLMSTGFACIGFDLGCKYTDEAYRNKECNKCIYHKSMKCPNSSKCYNTLDKPYFRV